MLDQDITAVGVKSRTDSQTIYRSVLAMIQDGRLANDNRLPTERAIAVRFNAARNTVRRAMRQLVDDGVVVRHVGRGTFIVPEIDKLGTGASEVAEFDIATLIEARLLFEPQLAELVVARATEEEILGFEVHLAALRAANDWISFKEAKYALHVAMARASKNAFVISMFDRILAARRAASWGGTSRRNLPVSLVREAAVIESTAIVDALRRRDGRLATQLIRAYLQRTLVSVTS